MLFAKKIDYLQKRRSFGVLRLENSRPLLASTSSSNNRIIIWQLQHALYEVSQVQLLLLLRSTAQAHLLIVSISLQASRLVNNRL
jgi:hypothetical protein